MKILICTNHSYMFWQFRRELTGVLLQQGEVVLSTPFVGHEEDLRAMGCRLVETQVDRRGINPLTDSKLLAFYWRLLRRERPELVITYSIKPNIYCSLACQLQGIAYCVNVQGLGTAFQRPGIARLATLLYRLALRRAKTTFFENQENAREFVRRGIQPPQKQTVLSGAGVNLQHYSHQSYPQNSPIHFLYLGRIMKEKGMDELFYAARRLKAGGTDFVLDLVGFYEDSYRQQVEQLEAEGIVVFHGFQADPRPFYQAADCVVLPSYHEGMSNVLLEAAATGRPLITSDIPGCQEAVEQGESGFLVPVKNGEELYRSMKQLAQLPRSRREAMGRRGRQRMEQLFDKELVIERSLAGLGVTKAQEKA